MDSLYAAKLPDGLYVRLETSKGDITCRFFADKTPVAMRNFGMLAQGVTTWVDSVTKKPVRRPLYDGTIFYRIVPDSFIEGGDPTGTGTGGPGFQYEEEIRDDLKFDRPGLLALGNQGPGTSGSRFFITLKSLPEMDGQFTIFGEVVKGLGVVKKINRQKVDNEGRPLKPVILRKAVIFRVPSLP